MRPDDCCGYPVECARACSERDAYMDWAEYWDNLSDEERAAEQQAMADYAANPDL